MGTAQMRRMEGRIRQASSQDQRQVVAFLEDVGEGVGQLQVQIHLGIALGIAGQALDQIVLAEAGHGVDAQPPARHRQGVTGLSIGFVEVGEDALAAREVAFAGVRQAQLAGGAMQQPGLQVLLQLTDRPGDIGGGEFQLARGGGETAGLGHAGEGAQIEEMIHGRGRAVERGIVGHYPPVG